MSDLPENGYISKFLTHFVGQGQAPWRQFDLLCRILDSGELLPAGRAEAWQGNVHIRRKNPFSSNKLLYPEIVCFCDIPLCRKMLEIHTRKYGRFGIAFAKKWVADRGANPVLYVAKGSACTDHRFPGGHPGRDTKREQFFDLAVADWLKQMQARARPPEHWSRSDNLLFWYLLCYCQFFDETLEEREANNYYMEREWRTIGKVKFKQEDVAHVILPKEYESEFANRFPRLAEKTWSPEAD